METAFETDTDHLAGLTDAQREAVEHREGPALVIAGPGSGKTRVITRRIAHLLKSGVRASRILALTFTNKAAGEMRERVEQLVPEAKVVMGTFHSFASRTLRRYCQELNLDKNFGVCDEADRSQLIRECMTALGLQTKDGSLGEVSDAISRAKNSLVPAGRHHLDLPEHSAINAMVHRRYQWALRRSGRLDFDDLLNLLADALRQNERLRAKLDDQFRYILVDEYQDTNPAQYLILRLLTRDVDNLMVVGDPDQSIYRFRNADIRNILEFERDYPKARVVKLEHNYRSTPEILRAADQLIRNNRERIEKVLIPTRGDGARVEVYGHQTEQCESKAIAEDIQRSVEFGRKYADHAVLVRVHRLVRGKLGIEQALLRRGIPYKVYGGLGFLGRQEVKDILAYCRLATCPMDRLSFSRVVNEPNRGVGKLTLAKLLDWAADNELPPLAACRVAGRIDGIRGKTLESLAEFVRVVDRLATLTDRPGELVREAALATGYRQSIADKQTEEAAERVAIVDQLIDLGQRYADDNPTSTMAEFLEQITLGESDESGEEEDEEQDRVAIMTLHGAKGLEFPVVYLPGLEMGILPGQQAISAGFSGDPAEIEEERRTFFVGMTRAMDRLVISLAKFRMTGDKFAFSPHSQFLDELPMREMAVRWYT